MPKRILLKCNRHCLITNCAAQNVLFCRAKHETPLSCLGRFLKGYGIIFTSEERFSLTHQSRIRSLWKQILLNRDTSPMLECPAHCRAYISALGHRTGKYWEYCYSSGIPKPHAMPLKALPLGTSHLFACVFPATGIFLFGFLVGVFLWAALLNP